jgi:hypothetical protein
MFSIDRYRLIHWLNVRKLTPALVERESSLTAGELRAVADGRTSLLTEAQAHDLAAILNVDLAQLAGDEHPGAAVIYRSREQLLATRRAIERDGIHFYNYYTLPAPKGHVAPVVLDILCPAGRLPALNNGHLEPAITVNIGPGDIYGRWGEALNDTNWQVLKAGSPHDWIAGDSYVEPAYCPHAYSLATAEPAQIISYTCKSNLEHLLTSSNRWSDAAFHGLVSQWSDHHPQTATLLAHMSRRGYDAQTLSHRTGVNAAALASHLDDVSDALTIEELQSLAGVLGIDYRILLPPSPCHDPVGKTSRSIAESLATARPFRSYTVASLAFAPHLPDLAGLCLSVEQKSGTHVPDLMDHAATHYFVTRGQVTLCWQDDDRIATVELSLHDTAWIGPFVRHGFTGAGALLKLGNGEGASYLDQLECSNTFQPAATLRRGRQDRKDWGYDDR